MKFHRCIYKLFPRIPSNQLDFSCLCQFFLDPHRRPGGPVTPIIEPFPVDPINPGPFPPNPPSTIPCRYGRQINQQGLCSNFIGNQQCPAGFVCNFGPADEPGPCCLSEYFKKCWCFCILYKYVLFCCFSLNLAFSYCFCCVDVI